MTERKLTTDQVKGLFISGTGTGVGKTIVTAALARVLYRLGVNVGVMKAIETGLDCPQARADSDASFLSRAACVKDQPELICPVWFREPAAPIVAARVSGCEVDLDCIRMASSELQCRHEFLLVEGAGGLMVPICKGYVMADLAKDLRMPILIVGQAGLGALNEVALSDYYARGRDLEVVAILLNQRVPGSGSIAEKTNPAILAEMTSAPVLGPLGYVSDPHSECGLNSLADLMKALPGFEVLADRVFKRRRGLNGSDGCSIK